MKILIVEDEEMIREGISDYLTDCGYETIEAADGQEALEQFSSYEVALVLVVLVMALASSNLLRKQPKELLLDSE